MAAHWPVIAASMHQVARFCPGVLRKNSIQIDSTWHFRLERFTLLGWDVLLMILLVQALSLVTFARFHRTTVLRLAVLRQQLAVCKRSAGTEIPRKPQDNRAPEKLISEGRGHPKLFQYIDLHQSKKCFSPYSEIGRIVGKSQQHFPEEAPKISLTH